MVDFTIKQNDDSPTFSRTLKNGLTAVDLSSVNDVRFHMKNTFGEVVLDTNTSGQVSVTNATSGDVEVSFTQSDTDTVGKFYGEFEVEYSDGTFETFPPDRLYEIEIIEEIA